VRAPARSQFFFFYCPGAGTGRQAWLRAMCPLGRAGSIPALGTISRFDFPPFSADFYFPYSYSKFIIPFKGYFFSSEVLKKTYYIVYCTPKYTSFERETHP